MPLSPQALRRRAKKFLVRNQLQLFVPVLPGLERLTAEQAKSIGQEIRIVHGGIEFRGDLASIYRANLAVRTGNRVLLRLGQFLSQSYPMLYNHARRIDWPAVLGNCPDVSIDVSARESRLNHKEGIRQAILDAIRSSMAEHDVNTVLVDGGPLTVKARLYQDRCTLSLDTTGEHLHKRGYRSHATTAPIRETTAAGMLLLAQSKSYDVIIDPFCGSGTFAIEAELIARNYPPRDVQTLRNREQSFARPECFATSAGSCSRVLATIPLRLFSASTSRRLQYNQPNTMPTRPPRQGSSSLCATLWHWTSAVSYPKGRKG